MATTQEEKIAIKGGCHCGFITYTARATPNPQGTLSATRCNCTFCQRLGYTNLALFSPSDFTLHSPATLSDPMLGDYAPRIKSVHRYFCRSCGTHVWMQGEFPLGDGKMVPVMAVNLGSVEQPQEGVELRETRLRYFDMLHGNVEGGLRDGPWPGGLV